MKSNIMTYVSKVVLLLLVEVWCDLECGKKLIISSLTLSLHIMTGSGGGGGCVGIGFAKKLKLNGTCLHH